MNYSKFTADAIIEKNFHDIPDWLIENIDDEAFFMIVDKFDDIMLEDGEVSCKVPHSEKFLDAAEVIGRIREKSDLNIKNIMTTLTRNSSILKCLRIIPFFVHSDKDWKIFLKMYKKIDVRNFCEDLKCSDLNPFLMLLDGMFKYYYRKRSIPRSVVKYILDFVDYCSINNSNPDILENTIWGIYASFHYSPYQFLHEIYGVKEVCDSYADDLYETILSFSSTYPWIDSIFSVIPMWSKGVTYYPKNIGPEYMYPYLCYISEGADVTGWTEISDNIMPHLKHIVHSPEYDDEFKKELCDIIGTLLLNKNRNLNNIRFLKPFKDSALYTKAKSKYIDPVVADVCESKYDNESLTIKLRDYTYLGGMFFGEYGLNNDKLQRGFLEGGGNPNSLIPKDEDNTTTFLFTKEGILCMLKYSTFDQVEDVIMNKCILYKILHEIVGKEPFRPAIDTLIPHLVKHCEDDDVQKIITRICANYALDNFYWCLDSLKVLPLGSVEISQILKDCPDAISYIPFRKQDYMGFLKKVMAKGGYIPIYFGPKNDEEVGLERYLNTAQIIFLLKESPGYVGDIKSKKIANMVVNNIFIFEKELML